MLLQRRDVAVEPEQALGGDQRGAAVELAQGPREVLGVAVVVGDAPRRPRAGSRRRATGGTARRGGRPRRGGRAPGSRRGWPASPSRTAARRASPVKPARRSSSRRCSVIVPDATRAAPAPTPQRIAASAAASRTRGWSARPSELPEHSSRTGRPSSTTRGPCGPLTIRRRRYRPRSFSSSSRSSRSSIGSPRGPSAAARRSRGNWRERVRPLPDGSGCLRAWR